METEPPGKKDQYKQDRDENQKTRGFHTNEIKDCGVELVSVPGRRLSRLFGDLASIASRVVRGRSSGVAESEKYVIRAEISVVSLT